MFKKDMRAPKGATKHVHKGKGSQMAPMPDRGQIDKLARGPSTMNDYAKATPMPQSVNPMDSMEGGF